MNESGEGRRVLDWPYLLVLLRAAVSCTRIEIVRALDGGARLRFSSFNRKFLEQVQHLVKGGSIIGETHSRGLYYWLPVTGYYRIKNVLTHLVPFLVRERLIVERWLLLHQADAEIARSKRSLRLKAGKFVRSKVRGLERQMSKLGLLPPPRDMR